MRYSRRLFISTMLGAVGSAYAGARHTGASEDADVVIIGAGLAGLNTARVLESYGVTALVLEGSARVGGRVYTLPDIEGAPDIGANQIGITYGELLFLAHQYGLTTFPFDYSPRAGRTISYNGNLFRAKDWLKNKHNNLPQSERSIPFGRWLSHFLPKPLGVDNLDFYAKTNSPVPDSSLQSYLNKKNASDALIRLMQLNFNGNFDTFSLHDLYRRLITRRAAGKNPPLFLRGGLSQIPNALARSLQTGVRLNQLVTGVSVRKGVYQTQTASGALYRSRMVVCAVPPSVLAGITLPDNTPPFIKQAIAHCNFVPVTRTYFYVDKPFWEKDGLPKTMWTDTPLGLLSHSAGTTEKKANLYGNFAMGEQAVAMDRLLKRDRNAPLTLLESIRPATKGALRIAKTVSWGQNPFSLGAFSTYSAGMLSRIVPGFKNQTGSLLFAGEHTESGFAPGMEAALSSGSTAANRLLTTMGKI